MRPLVILRPEPGASGTAAAAETVGLHVRKMPLFEVRPLDWHAPDATAFDALLLTSANACRCGGAQLDSLRALPAHCVGEATAAAARNAGFTVASVGAAGVDSLLGSLPSNLRLLHLCGADRRQLAQASQRIEQVAVYEAAELPMPQDLGRIEGSVVAIHSPRAGKRLRTVCEKAGIARRSIAVAAISSEAADAAGEGWQAVRAAAQPNDAALLAIASDLCNNAADGQRGG